MATRLTKVMCETILRAMIDHRFKAQIEALATRYVEIGHDIYRDVFGENVARMDALPAGWLPVVEKVAASLAGRVEFVPLEQGHIVVGRRRRHLAKPVGERRRAPYGKLGCVLKTYDATEDVVVRHRAVIDDHEALNETVATTEDVVAATLGRFGTVEKMLKLWPEAEPFVPKPGPTHALPVVPILKINELLDLPVE